MKKKWFVGILIYIGLIALCCVVLYAVPSVRGMLEKTYIAEYGRIDVTDEVSAFIVRDETVYAAAQPSNINRLAEADKLVKASTRVVELTPDETAIRAAEEAKAKEEEKSKSFFGSKKTDTEDSSTGLGKYAGIMAELGDSVEVTSEGYTNTAGYISYYVDGAESKLSTSALDSLRYEDYKELTGRTAVEVPDTKCGAGYPVFKVTKNGKWYLVYYLTNEKAAKYEAGDTVTVDFNGTPVDVTVSRVQTGQKYSKITLSCKSFFDGFLEVRNIDTTVTVASAEGLILQDDSIIETPEGQRGVFVKNKLGEHIFKPVRVKADDGTRCVAYSDIYVDDGGNYVETIGTYDEIVSEPTDEDMTSLIKTQQEVQQDVSQ